MRSPPLFMTALVLLAALAGCSNAPGGGADPLAEIDVEATATTGVIRGVVVDQAVRPLAGALVVLTSSGKNTTTNEAGAFGFDGLDAGVYFLSASLANYTTAQQSVDVVAGVDEPDAVRILLAAIPRGTPRVSAQQATIFVESSIIVAGRGYTLGGVTTENFYWFEVDIDPNATVAQTEISWTETTPLGDSSRIGGGTYAGNDAVDTENQIGLSPLVFRANATQDGAVANNVYYAVFAGDSNGLPVGMHANQQFDCYIHTFYNFMPRDDWQFSRDGDYPVPA